LAKKFEKEHSNSNARKIFLCSLLYLPFLLAAYIFHSKNWKSVESNDEIPNTFSRVKEALKSVCIHEVMAQKQSGNGSSTNDVSTMPSAPSPLCPKVAVEKSTEKVGIAVHHIVNDQAQQVNTPRTSKSDAEQS